MPQVQARLDLPQRRTRSKAGKEVTPVKVEEVSGGEENTAPDKQQPRPRRQLLKPVQDPEALLRTPRGGRRKAAASATPSKEAAKRPGTDTAEVEAATKVSPSKQPRTPLKPIKDNVAIGLSPCSGLSKMALNSPKVNVSAKKCTREPLFKSPPKLTNADVCNLLDSPDKTKSPAVARSRTPRQSLNPTPTKSLFPSKSPVRLSSNQLEDILCSPKPAVKSSVASNNTSSAAANLFQSPCKSRSRTPVKKAAANLFPSKSPRRVTSQQLEDLLCSPVKAPSPAPRLPSKSPRKPATPSKLGSSPLKRTALFSPAKPAAAPIPAKPAPVQATIGQLQAARAALHTGTPAPGQLLCRGEQVAAMEQWLDQHLNTNMPGSMYVSGAPGTGKTATLTHLLETKVTKEYKSIFIN